MKNMPEHERPRERLAAQGPEALLDAELLAILLGSGIKGKSVLQLSQEILMQASSLEVLAGSSLEELQTIQGVGPAKALQLVALFALARRIAKAPIERLSEPITDAAQAYNLVKTQLEQQTRELFVVVLQDVRKRLICTELVAIGSLSQVIVHPREVFYPAIRHKASSLIVAHNHPSGDPTPSADDRQVTRRIARAGETLGVALLDHLVVGAGTFTSLAREGVL